MSSRKRSLLQGDYGSSGTQFPDNSTGLITPSIERTFGQDITDSHFNLTDDQYTGAKGLYLNITDTTGLKALVTVGVNVNIVVFFASSGLSLSTYKLIAGTDAESLPNVVRPNDYDGSTNQKVWKLCSPTGTDVISGLTAPRIPFATSATTLGDDASLQWDSTNKVLTVGDGTHGSVHVNASNTDSLFKGYSASALQLSISNNGADIILKNENSGGLDFNVGGSSRVYINTSGALSFNGVFGLAGQIPYSQGSSLPLLYREAGLNEPDRSFIYNNDFINNSFAQALSNGGTVSTSGQGIDNTSHAMGVYDLSTGINTNGAAGIGTASSTGFALFTFGYGYTFTTINRILLTILSDGTNTYTARIGFCDYIAASITDGAYFRYTHGTNSGKWQAITMNSSIATSTDTGITADTNWHIFKIVTDPGSANIKFYIDGNLVATNTTNIVNGNSLFGTTIAIEKSAGTTARHLYADYIQMSAIRSSSR